ncbi:hypothetical protein GRF29_1536g673276 [Pseudopithomyces chartarum]|uniref:Uncharacterized protein n=1 Tax=Pseudopithomyces chartarum TaxID=1892770 RepID=A0AAN6RC31_9PLEO|nr:hypothetical protein GRF29_1536g673276 [Pseudopithomyces chartarum]
MGKQARTPALAVVVVAVVVVMEQRTRKRKRGSGLGEGPEAIRWWSTHPTPSRKRNASPILPPLLLLLLFLLPASPPSAPPLGPAPAPAFLLPHHNAALVSTPPVRIAPSQLPACLSPHHPLSAISAFDKPSALQVGSLRPRSSLRPSPPPPRTLPPTSTAHRPARRRPPRPPPDPIVCRPCNIATTRPSTFLLAAAAASCATPSHPPCTRSFDGSQNTSDHPLERLPPGWPSWLPPPATSCALAGQTRRGSRLARPI